MQEFRFIAKSEQHLEQRKLRKLTELGIGNHIVVNCYRIEGNLRCLQIAEIKPLFDKG